MFTSLERDVLEYAEATTNTPPAVTDELSDRSLGQLGPAAMVELTACIAFANLSTRSNTALGIQPRRELRDKRRHARTGPGPTRSPRIRPWQAVGGRARAVAVIMLRSHAGLSGSDIARIFGRTRQWASWFLRVAEGTVTSDVEAIRDNAEEVDAKSTTDKLWSVLFPLLDEVRTLERAWNELAARSR